MAGKKTHPEKVIIQLAEQVIITAKDSHDLYSAYIRGFFRGTGKLAPGCDARDLLAWYEINMPEQLNAITKTRKGL